MISQLDDNAHVDLVAPAESPVVEVYSWECWWPQSAEFTARFRWVLVLLAEQLLAV